jgi:hypothetical protein
VATDVKSVVPVWTLSTSSATKIPALADSDALTPARLSELRSALAAFADSPIVTLEAHPLPKTFDRSSGIPLDALSPLAQHLAQLVSQTAKSSSAVANVEATGEVLYRMVVPAKVAAQVGKGLVKSMKSKAVPGGVYGALTDGSRIVAQSAFVPVAAQTTAAAAAGGAAATAGVTVATAGALTVAAPLVLMAVAVGVSAYADQQRQQAIERITELLEKLHLDKLDEERAELDGCRDAIDKATAVLLDQGKIGASLGLDSAVHAIGKATELARHRLSAWRAALDGLPAGPVEMSQISDAFPGIEEDGGEFRAHLELAALAIALKRRVIVLQAVEHSQSDIANPFENFVRSLKADQQRVDQLEAGIASALLQLSSLELRSPGRLLGKVMTRGQVDDLLAVVYRLRELGEGILPDGNAPDVAIEIAKNADGSILVLPAAAA